MFFETVQKVGKIVDISFFENFAFEKILPVLPYIKFARTCVLAMVVEIPVGENVMVQA